MLWNPTLVVYNVWTLRFYLNTSILFERKKRRRNLDKGVVYLLIGLNSKKHYGCLFDSTINGLLTLVSVDPSDKYYTQKKKKKRQLELL